MPQAAEARLRRQVHLGDVAALVRQADRRSPGARHRRRADRAALGDGARRHGRHRLRQGDRQERQDLPAEDGDAARGRVRVEDPEVEQHHRARPRADLLPGLRGRRARCYFVREGAGRAARRPDQDVDRVQGAGRGDRLRLPRGGARRAVAPRRDPRRQDRQLPPVSADAVERQPARHLRHARARTRMRCRTRRSSRRTARTTSRASTSCAPCAASIPCLPCGVHMYLGNGKVLETRHSPMFGNHAVPG